LQTAIFTSPMIKQSWILCMTWYAINPNPARLYGETYIILSLDKLAIERGS
jgi:hypothetical protein